MISDFFILFYLLFCFFWFQGFNVIWVYKLVHLLGLDHSWSMFAQPQLFNTSISCGLHFKDGSYRNFKFSEFESKSLIHRKYIDSLAFDNYLKSGLSDYIINFSGIENIIEVSIETEFIKIKPYNNYWKEECSRQISQ